MDVKELSEEERKEIVSYGIERGIVNLITFAVTLFSGFLLGVFYQSIIFLLCLNALRKYTGGYHADTQKRCFVISFGIIIVSLLAIRQLDTVYFNRLWCVLAQTISLAVIIALSPMESANRPLDESEKKKFGARARITGILLYIVSVSLYLMKWNSIGDSIGTAEIAAGILLLAGLIKNARGKRYKILYQGQKNF